jgi:hypothetical protein
MRDATAAPPELPGEALCRRQRARQWQVMLRLPHEDCLAALRACDGFESFEVRSPSLEEIFVAYIQHGRDDRTERPAAKETRP